MGLENRSMYALVDSLGIALLAQGDVAEAERTLQWLVDVIRRGQATTSLFPQVLLHLGWIHQKQGLDDDAASAFMEAARLVSSLPQWSDVGRAEMRVEIGTGLRALGRNEDAETVLHDAVDNLRGMGEERPELFTVALDQLAEARSAMGALDEAEQVVSELTDFVTTYFPPGHVEVAKAQLTAGKIALKRGKHDFAYEQLARAHAAAAKEGAALGFRIEVTFSYARAVHAVEGATPRTLELIRDSLRMLEGTHYMWFSATIHEWATERGMKP